MSALADESKDVEMADTAVDEDTVDDVSPRQSLPFSNETFRYSLLVFPPHEQSIYKHRVMWTSLDAQLCVCRVRILLAQHPCTIFPPVLMFVGSDQNPWFCATATI
jgi:hypothetical protein